MGLKQTSSALPATLGEQDHHQGSNSFCVISWYGTAKHGMRHNSVNRPRQVDDHSFHYFATTDNAAVNTP